MGRITFNVNEYTKFVKEKAKIIKEHPLDSHQIHMLYEQFFGNMGPYIYNKTDSQVDFNSFHEALCEFALATQIAYSKYRTENRNLWSKIFGFVKIKIPKIDAKKFLNLQS